MELGWVYLSGRFTGRGVTGDGLVGVGTVAAGDLE